MPKFDFDIPVTTEAQNAFNKIKTFLTSENNFKKFDPQLACTFDEPQKRCELNGSQFKASLKVSPTSESECTVNITVDLPFALSLFKGKIKDEIEKSFKKVLG